MAAEAAPRIWLSETRQLSTRGTEHTGHLGEAPSMCIVLGRVSNKKDEVGSERLPSGATLLKSTRGSAQLQRLADGFLLFECTGMLSTPFYEPMVAPAAREIEQTGKLAIFVDGWSLHSVDTGFREKWTEWFKRHKQQFHMRLLVRTKLMDMAASLANLFTGIHVIKTYSKVEAWEAACRGDLPSFNHSVRPRD
jgi:hypothetical protein